jgi:outer membrane protein assembly factor BamB
MQLLTTLLVFSLCLFPTLAAAVSPHIYDTPQAGPPGSKTNTVGNGWDPNATLDIYLDSTSVGVVDTDNNGSFGMALKAPTLRQNGLTIQIPNNAVPGQHWITAVERITQIQAQVAFLVRTDWPQLRYGPDRTGFNPSETILSPETVGNLTARWTHGGMAAAEPALANGLIYVSWVNNGDRYVEALDAGTSALLWSYPGQPNGALEVVNGVVYFGDYNGMLYALNANTGALLWSYQVGGWVGTPAVANGVVYVGGIYYVDALDASTGALLWQAFLPNNDYWFSSRVAVANGVVYAGTEYQGLYALDANTGALLWQHPTYQINFPPAVANGIVYIVLGDTLDALNAGTGALIWENTSPNYGISGAPAIANGMVYLASDNLYALDASTGALIWKSPIQGNSPAVANGILYVGSNDYNLYALSASTGTLLWSYRAETTVDSPVVVNGMVYVGCDDGNLYAFGMPNQLMSEKFSPPERPDPARLTPNWNPTLKK